MRFNSPAEVKAWAEKAAAGDIDRHRNHGIDMNPFSTDGARNCWQRGFDGVPPESWQDPKLVEYDTIYQRGAACARLLKEEQS